MYSNCLLEAIIAWMQNPKEVVIKRMSSKMTHSRIPHFYWIDEKGFHQFKAKDRDAQKKWNENMLLFDGYFVHSKDGCKDYTEERNRR